MQNEFVYGTFAVGSFEITVILYQYSPRAQHTSYLGQKFEASEILIALKYVSGIILVCWSKKVKVN